ASQASATKMPGPPTLVSTATRRPAGTGCDDITAATSNISSRVSARITPALVHQALAPRLSGPHSRSVRGRCPAPGTGTAEFHYHDRLVPGDAPGDPGEPARIRHRLQVGQDEAGAGVLIPVQQQVVGRQVGGIANRHEAADAPRGAGEQGERGQPEAAGL